MINNKEFQQISQDLVDTIAKSHASITEKELMLALFSAILVSVKQRLNAIAEIGVNHG